MPYPTFSRDHLADIEAYEDSVIDGTRIACKWERLAIQRQLRDLERQEDPDFPYYFDCEAALRPIRFIECFPHIKGALASGGSFEERLIAISPWQKWFVGCGFGWRKKESGLRRFSLIELYVSRKAGKSTIAAPLGLYMLTADGESGAEVYCGATTQNQAQEVFTPAYLMARASTDFRKRFAVETSGTYKNPKGIFETENNGKFIPLIGKPGDGSNPSFWICDEYHEHVTNDFVDTMVSGQGARLQGLGLIITTAGSNPLGPCHQQQKELEEILAGTREAENRFGIIYTADESVPWDSMEALEMANPNMGITPTVEYLQEQLHAAKQSPRLQNRFKIKNLNQWVTAKEAWLNVVHINAAVEDLDIEDFRGQTAGMGLDLSESDDLTAKVVCFEKQIEGKSHYYFFGRYYAAEAKVNEIELYQQWVRHGHLISCDGSMIDYEQVELDVQSWLEIFYIEQLFFDPAGAAQMAQRINNSFEIEAVKFAQSYTNYSPIMRDFEGLLKSGRIHIENNPCLQWMLGNIVAKETMDGKYIRPVKETRMAKIDGGVALLQAFAVVYTPELDDGSSQSMVDIND